MRLEFASSNSSIVAVSLNQPPAWELPLDTCIRYHAPPSTSPSSANVSVVIEVLLNREPRRIYGLVGAQFAENDSHVLSIVVPIVEVIQASFNPIRPIDPMEIVTPGLPAEYAGGVLVSAAAQQQKVSRLGSGVLTFKWAAYAHHASHARVFEALAGSIVELFDSQEEDYMASVLTQKFKLDRLSWKLI